MNTISMTQAELERLRGELSELETAGRSEIAARIKTARGWGDLKENAEYHAAKDAQAHLETRILKLREQLRSATVVAAGSDGSVRHGSRVNIRELSDQSVREIKIVSPNEARPSEGLLSATSPISQALVGHTAGEVVQVQTPRGTRELRIESVE